MAVPPIHVFAAPGMEPCSFELTGKPVADEQKIRFLDIKVQISDDWLTVNRQRMIDWLTRCREKCRLIRESIKGAWTGLWRGASSLAQSVHGGSAQVNEKRLQGAAMLWKRLYKHDETEETRRPARPKYKKFYPVLVSPVNFLNWWQCWSFLLMILMFALTPKFQHLLQKDDCVPMFADVTPFLVRYVDQNGKET